jgi:hypothetical protein
MAGEHRAGPRGFPAAAGSVQLREQDDQQDDDQQSADADVHVPTSFRATIGQGRTYPGHPRANGGSVKWLLSVQFRRSPHVSALLLSSWNNVMGSYI